ncbi:hypothetical protein CLOACE_11950 [Clostridium acetireducens DSM 10703]|uniref:Uncharacterized protein n=1 Tax=Clostridium acetireducens DSM 10703 TaxID=1121290 RepID=A0A1E8EZL7_9CLOT|nr:hypothetical protein [Clostridium acetireducens]OFI06162.1 hypothetical protein CLOACE_11950 [Clostridium acetireducens DSM 10703]
MELVKKEKSNSFFNERVFSLKSYIMYRETDLTKKNIKRFKELNSKYNKYINNLKHWYIPKNLKCDYDLIIRLLKEAKKNIQYIENSDFKNILKVYYNNDFAYKEITYLYLKCKNNLKEIVSIKKQLDNHIICIADNTDINLLKNDIDKLINKFNNFNNKLVKLWINFDKSIVKYCRVDFQNVDSIEKAYIIKNYIKARNTFENIKVNWNNVMLKYNGPKIRIDSNMNLMYMESLIKKLGVIVNYNSIYKSNIFKHLRKVRIGKKINWYNSNSYDYLIKCVYSIKYLEEYKNLKAYIQVLKKISISC